MILIFVSAEQRLDCFAFCFSDGSNEFIHQIFIAGESHIF